MLWSAAEWASHLHLRLASLLPLDFTFSLTPWAVCTSPGRYFHSRKCWVAKGSASSPVSPLRAFAPLCCTSLRLNLSPRLSSLGHPFPVFAAANCPYLPLSDVPPLKCSTQFASKANDNIKDNNGGRKIQGMKRVLRWHPDTLQDFWTTFRVAESLEVFNFTDVTLTLTSPLIRRMSPCMPQRFYTSFRFALILCYQEERTQVSSQHCVLRSICS